MQSTHTLHGFVETVRRLIMSHGAHDDAAFRESAEALVRELSVTNRPGEAKALRDALGSFSSNGKISQAPLVAPPVSGRSGESLISLRQPIVRRDAVVLTEEASESFTRIGAEYANALALAEAGLTPRNKFLFWGPPGCGKSVTAEALATELGWPFGVVRLSSIISSFVGETASNLQKIFTYANTHQMVLLFDEADAIAKDREDRNDVGELKRVVNSLLQCLDQLAGRRSIVALASNHQHLLDPAVWRRFDDVVEFPIPSREARLSHLKHLTSGLPLKGSLLQVAEKTSGVSFAQIERAVQEVAKSAIMAKTSEVETGALLDEVRRWQKKQAAACAVRARKQ